MLLSQSSARVNLVIPPAPEIRVPRWNKRPSGIIVPTALGRTQLAAFAGELPHDLPLPAPSVAIIGRPPSSFDQFGAYPDEVLLGFPRSTSDDLVVMASALPFERTMHALAQIAAHVEHLDRDLEAQLAFAHEVFGDTTLCERLAAFINGAEGYTSLFPPQHIAAWQRLLVLHGADIPQDQQPPADSQAIFNRAFYALGCLTEAGLGDINERDGRSRWLAFLIQNGVYNSVDPTLEAMARPATLFLDIADDFRQHQDYCDVDQWFVEDYGLSIGDQAALSMAVLAASKVRDDKADAKERSILSSGFLADVANRLGKPVEVVRDLISADRSWYAQEFAGVEITESRAVWDRTPFEKRPLLQLASGQLLLLSPLALGGWQSDGFYHRALACARRRKQIPRLQRFYGVLIERYVVETLQSAHPEPRPAGAGRVTGDRPYGRRGGMLTPDFCVDCGPDLIVGEVASGRFTLPTLVDGDDDAAARDLERLVFNKLDQLGARIADLLDGHWSPPDVALAEVQSIWPVLVTSNVIQNELLWDEIDVRAHPIFADARVKSLTLLDVEDVEQLAGIVEAGFGMADVIRQKATGPYARLDFRRFVNETANIPHEVRLDAIERKWLRSVVDGMSRLGFDIDEQRLRAELDARS